MRKSWWKNFSVFLFLFFISTLFFLRIKNEMVDFEVYWKSGKRIYSGQQLYVPEDGHYTLKYIPSFALFIVPLSFFPLPIAKGIWFFLSILFVFLFFHFSLKILPEKRLDKWKIFILSGLCVFKFIARELDLGQTNIIMGVLFLAGFYLARRGDNLLSGTFLALSFCAKPYSIVSLPYLLLKRKISSFLYLTFFIVILFLLPSLVYGFYGNFQLIKGWLHTIFSSTPHLLVSNDNVSIMGMFSKWFGVGKLSLILSIWVIFLLSVSFIWAMIKGRSLKDPEPLELSVILIFIPLFSPQGWDYVFLLSLPAVMILVNYYQEFPIILKILIPVTLFTIGFSLFDLMGRRAYEKFMEISVITIAYFVIIVSLFYLRFKKVA